MTKLHRCSRPLQLQRDPCRYFGLVPRSGAHFQQCRESSSCWCPCRQQQLSGDGPPTVVSPVLQVAWLFPGHYLPGRRCAKPVADIVGDAFDQRRELFGGSAFEKTNSPEEKCSQELAP